MLDDPEIVQTAERCTAVIHLTVPRTEIGKFMGPAIAEVMAAIAAQSLKPEGPCFSYHFKRPLDSFDFEVGFPVGRPMTPVGRVGPGKLPASRVARSIYRGDYAGLGAAWGQLFGWIEAQGLGTREDLWECYVTGPESSPDATDWRTELNRPLAD